MLQEDDNGNPLPGGELNIIFDNCSGQNKNNYVLWLVPYLVEAGYFKTVNFIFLVVGHTKNACDRRFNNVKQVYNKSNVYSFDMCVEIADKSKHVTLLPVQDGEFRDYQTWLGDYYRQLASVGIKLTEQQIFSSSIVDCFKDGIMHIIVWQSNLEEDLPTMKPITKPTHQQQLQRLSSVTVVPSGTSGSITSTSAAPEPTAMSGPTVIPFQGIPTFKQVQLYNNYRCLLPHEYQDITCPKPPPEVLKAEEEDQQRRKIAKKVKLQLEKEAKVKKTQRPRPRR
jgi:hypothetical protein